METSNKIDNILQHITSLLTRDSDQILLEQLGIGYSQYKIINLIKNGKSVKQRFISSSLGQTEASISRQIDILISKKLINKQIDPHNKRIRLISISQKGKKIADATNEVLAKFHKSILTNFSDKQQGELLKLLEELHSNLCRANHSTDIDYLSFISQK